GQIHGILAFHAAIIDAQSAPQRTQTSLCRSLFGLLHQVCKLRDGDRRQDSDDCDHDHQLDERKSEFHHFFVPATSHLTVPPNYYYLLTPKDAKIFSICPQLIWG